MVVDFPPDQMSFFIFQRRSLANRQFQWLALAFALRKGDERVSFEERLVKLLVDGLVDSLHFFEDKSIHLPEAVLLLSQIFAEIFTILLKKFGLLLFKG